MTISNPEVSVNGGAWQPAMLVGNPQETVQIVELAASQGQPPPSSGVPVVPPSVSIAPLSPATVTEGSAVVFRVTISGTTPRRSPSP